MNHILRVARMQLVNSWAIIGLPIGILLLAVAANVVIFVALSAPDADGELITGGILSIYITLLISHLQTMTQMFPFAVGLSVTRKAFLGAAALIVTAQSFGYAVLLWLLELIEKATGGWGLDLTFFALPFLDMANPLAQILVYAAPFLVFSFFGLWVGIVYKRWGQFGAWALAVSLAGLGVAIVALVSWRGWWPNVGEFLTTQPTMALLVAYPVLIAAVLAGATYLTTRKAVP
ncbi:hypothetical protein ACFS2C_26045 [Prauserella oleivorans]|uniref:ABC transporter permease n=1 Tax=Prauserella oleivorans TaxID=1478153 RepID=A0ABW5WGY6_9PSEU